MTARYHARYMLPVDERILEYLTEEPWATAVEMADVSAFDVPEATIQERCKVLADIDFLVPAVDESCSNPDMWEITGWGELYLDGEIDARHRRPTKRALRG